MTDLALGAWLIATLLAMLLIVLLVIGDGAPVAIPSHGV